MSWTYAFAREIGTMHANGVCEDYALCAQDGPALICVASDGAGSAELASIGSQVVCETFLQTAKSLLLEEADVRLWGPEQHQRLLLDPLQAIRERSQRDGRAIAEYSATMIGSILTGEATLCCQIGDGAVVGMVDGQFKPLMWPEESEFANTTFFVTSPDAPQHFFTKTIDQALDFVALFTDGIQYLVLDFKAKTAHQPFFQTVYQKCSAGTEGLSDETSDWLQKMLESPQVKERTDDDTSVVTACRFKGGSP